MVVANMTGPGSFAPYPKIPVALSPPAVFAPQLTQGNPLSHPKPESTSMPKKSHSVEGAHEQPAPMDVDSPIDGVDDSDSYGSDYSDPPEYPLDPTGVEQESDAIQDLKPTHGSPQVGPPQAGPVSANNCIVCHRAKPLKDVSTCGERHCDQQLKEWQGLGSSRPNASVLSRNRCPVCNHLKPIGDTICESEFCVTRLKFWEFGQSPSPSNGRPVQTRNQTQGGGMCEVCHQRPRYSHNGKTFPTCGLSCAAKLNASGRVEMCDFCHQRPKVVLNGRVYPHCGRTCRDKAKAVEANNGSNTGMCSTCLICWKAPANVRKDEFCSDPCREIMGRSAPLLLEIPRGHSSFHEVETKFKNSWTYRKAPCPSVKKIYMVCLPAMHDANFEDYGKKVSSTYGIPGSFLGKKKEEFRWISGLRECPLGHPGITTPCQHPQCQLCNILRGTYVPEVFGKGVLTTSLPRATHNYDRWASMNLRFKISKVVLLSKVYLGKVAELDSFQAGLGPPHGANSVNVVNYVHHARVETDEILVYTCEALRPVYLVSYD